MKPRIVIAGGSGFIGRSLQHHFYCLGYEVVVLTRSPHVVTGPARHVGWDGRTLGPWVEEIHGAAAIVNLAGRSVDCRYHEANRRVIRESRVDSVRVLGEAIARIKSPSGAPGVWVQAATTAIYGEAGDAVLDESATPAEGFSPHVAKAWEQAFHEVNAPHTRKVLLRISFVLGPHGGALRKLLSLARWGLGGSAGSGRQWVSWIDHRDLDRIVAWAIGNHAAAGLYHATSPSPVMNVEFMRELRRAVHRPWSPPAPAWAVRVGSFVLRTEPELALKGRRCVPRRLLKESFVFEHTDLTATLRSVLAPGQREKAA